MDTVLAQRGQDQKEFPRAAWDHMVESGATYGWELVTKVPAELLELQSKQQDSVDPGAANELKVFPDDLDKIKPSAEAGEVNGAADAGDVDPGDVDEPGEADKPRRGRPAKKI